MDEKPSRKKQKAIPEIKTKKIELRMTEKEYYQLENKVSETGKSRSKYVREAVLNGTVIIVPYAKEISANLINVRSQLNQLEIENHCKEEMQDKLSELTILLGKIIAQCKNEASSS